MLPNLIKSFFFSPFRLAFKLAFWATVLVLVAGLIFFLTFDLNDYKPIIEKRVSVFLKQELKIDGDVNLGMNFPRPSIALNDVRFDKTEIGKAEFTIPFDRSFSATEPAAAGRCDDAVENLDRFSWGSGIFPFTPFGDFAVKRHIFPRCGRPSEILRHCGALHFLPCRGFAVDVQRM